MNKSQCEEDKLDDLTAYLQNSLNFSFNLIVKQVLEVQAITCDTQEEIDDERKDADHLCWSMKQEKYNSETSLELKIATAIVFTYKEYDFQNQMLSPSSVSCI